MTKFFEPPKVESISELLRVIPLYGTMDISAFIETQWAEIESISRIRKHIFKQNASMMLFNWGQAKPSLDAEVLGHTVKYIRNPQDAINAYCPYCSQSSVLDPQWETWFWMGNDRHYQGDEKYHQEFFCTLFRCAKCKSQELVFSFRCEGNLLTKIWQFPSDRDLLTEEIHTYQKELWEYSPLFHTAISLRSFGIWAGSFVYLRRIFEALIFDSYSDHQAVLLISEDEFQKKRMDEKIEILSEFLPDFLVEHKHLYGILSKGVHELSEEECLENFDIVKTGIELILDEVIEKKKKLEKIKKFKTGSRSISK